MTTTVENQDLAPDDARLRFVATPLLVNTLHAAQLLGMSKTAFKSNLAAGTIGPIPIRFGKSVRFSVVELSNWCAANCPPREKWVELRAAGRPAEQMELRKAQ